MSLFVSLHFPLFFPFPCCCAVKRSSSLSLRQISPWGTGISVGMSELLLKQNKKTPISKHKSRLTLTVSALSHTHTHTHTAQPHDRGLERGDSRMHICFLWLKGERFLGKYWFMKVCVCVCVCVCACACVCMFSHTPQINGQNEGCFFTMEALTQSCSTRNLFYCIISQPQRIVTLWNGAAHTLLYIVTYLMNCQIRSSGTLSNV